MKNKDEIMVFLKELLYEKADFALLFGSWARDEDHVTRESDVDCAVYFHSDVAADRSYYDIAERFEYTVGRKLDLVCLNTADIIISAQVVATGEEIFAKSEEQLNGYRAHIMSRYLDFKQSRKIIENNILVRPNHGR